MGDVTKLYLIVCALFAFLSVAGFASADEPTAKPVEPIVYPAALICVEAPGTSAARPCKPWCDENAATDVLRLMRRERADGPPVIQWESVSCAEYSAEEKAA